MHLFATIISSQVSLILRGGSRPESGEQTGFVDHFGQVVNKKQKAPLFFEVSDRWREHSYSVAGKGPQTPNRFNLLNAFFFKPILEKVS